MPIYLSPRTHASSQAHPVFKARGIVSNTAGPLKDLTVSGIPLQPQVAYSGYTTNISAFIAATHRKATLPTSSVGYHLGNPGRPVMTLPLPKLALVPSVNLTNDQTDQFVKKLEKYEASYEKRGRTTTFYLQKPTYEIASTLKNRCVDHAFCEGDTLMPGDFSQLEYLFSIITEFLATNTYPAFNHPTDLSSGPDVEKRVARGTSYGVGVVHDENYIKLRDAVLTLNKPEARGTEEAKEAMQVVKKHDFSAPMQMTLSSAAEVVTRAKASPVPYTFNCGNVSEIPGNYSGHLFPYFAGMNIPDKATLRKLVLRHFFRNFGNTLDDCQANWVSMRASLDRISSTKVGMAIAHMFYGIDLALSTQTRLFVIIEDEEYLGFTLLGERYVIYDGQDFHAPKTHTQLAEEYESLSSHSNAIKLVARLLSTAELKDVPIDMPSTVEVKTEEIQSSGALLDKILGRVWTEELRIELTKSLKHLRYRQPYLQNTPANLLWLLEMLTAKRLTPIGEDVPVYIPSNFEMLDDRLARLLAAYGPDAPSLLTNNGRDAFALPRFIEVDGVKSLPTNAIEPPKFHVPLKGLGAAYLDWKKVIKDREIVMDFRERAGKNRCMVVQNKDAVGDIFFGLCAMVNRDTPVQTKKRERDDMEVDTGRARKRAAVAISNVEDFLSL